MAICSACEDVVQHARGEPGHDGLISLGLVRSLDVVSRKASHEAFVCMTCGTGWDYFHDKKNPQAGWARS
ncbi:hypothetical protein [Achromobacter pestifer]|uniref:Uncharacterized protein n=1 Tax=Achromobacter pestifer TaxID=1353889 RepID=A0A6S6YM55_9BURK|nr:hypothetical protein [Achromobacter pestifer]CAB3631256.1 hypothetical protein LMG3431_01289 [Achromobacter pestifer]